MLCLYAGMSAALIPILDQWYPILRQSYSLWLVPVMYVCLLLAFILLHIGVAVILYLMVSLKRPCKAYGFYRFLAKISVPLILSVLRIKVEITGEELIPRDKRFLLASNHTHFFDPIIYLGVFPELEISFIGKKEIADKMPLIAKFMWSLKGMFVDRSNLRSGAKVIIESVKLLKNGEVSICIFPEGTRSKNGEIGDMKSGASKIAIKAGVPLTVCTLKGVTDVLHRFPFRKTTVYLDVLKTYSPEEYEGSNAEQITEEIKEIMEENIKVRK